METKLQPLLSNPETIKLYFEKVRELQNSGEKYPVDLDDVWMLAYSRKDDAVSALKKNFTQVSDYQSFRMSPENSKGRHKQVYNLTVKCLEYFIATKIPAVFEVYRKVFHATAKFLESISSPDPAKQNLLGNLERTTQISNSKAINNKNFQEGGVEKAIEHNALSCLIHTGKYPKEIKEFAKEISIPSKFRQSAKEVLRVIKPEIAASMSVTDDFCKHGMETEEAATMCKENLTPIFAKMIELGMVEQRKVA